MAISQAMCTSFKQELLVGTHNFTASTGNSFKLALYVTPTTDGTTAICDFSDLTFSNVSITARGALIYNDTQADKAVCVLDFGGDKTATAGDFTISFPTANASSAIIRIA